MNPRILLGLIAASLFGASGCNDVSWPSERNITTLRVLGVKAQPPSLTPGESTQLSLLCEDGRNGPASDPTCNVTDIGAPNFVEVAWFAGCNNPEKNDPLKCLNPIAGNASELSSTVSETPASEHFAVSPTFEFTAPADILRASVETGGRTVRYGVSYVYFVACAGRLERLDDAKDRLPVECRDRSTNAVLDQTRVVTGYTTVYSYDVVRNANPTPVHLRLGRLDHAPFFIDVPPSLSCTNDTDCNESGAESQLWACRTRDSLCVPKVPHCDKAHPETCHACCVNFQLPLRSFELATLDGNAILDPLKSLWVEYYTNAGEVPDDARFGVPAPVGSATMSSSPCAIWQAPQTPTEEARVWMIVRDDRGGQAWIEQPFVVR